MPNSSGKSSNTTASGGASDVINASKNAQTLRKKLTFKPKSRTPSPQEERKKPVAQAKLKMPLFEDVDDDEDKKPKPMAPSQKRPAAAAATSDDKDGDDPDDFKARLARMLAGPAPSAVQKRPPAARPSAWQTSADIDEAKL